jgi:hypothetical protein
MTAAHDTTRSAARLAEAARGRILLVVSILPL